MRRSLFIVQFENEFSNPLLPVSLILQFVKNEMFNDHNLVCEEFAYCQPPTTFRVPGAVCELEFCKLIKLPEKRGNGITHICSRIKNKVT